MTMSRTPDAGQQANSNRFVQSAAAISALGGMLFGYDTGVISGAILFIQQDFALSPTLATSVATVANGGANLLVAPTFRTLARVPGRPSPGRHRSLDSRLYFGA